MEIRYYPNTDTAYIYLLGPGTETKVDESEEVAPGVVVDFDAAGRALGIEVYAEAASKLNLSKIRLERKQEKGTDAVFEVNTGFLSEAIEGFKGYDPLSPERC